MPRLEALKAQLEGQKPASPDLQPVLEAISRLVTALEAEDKGEALKAITEAQEAAERRFDKQSKATANMVKRVMEAIEARPDPVLSIPDMTSESMNALTMALTKFKHKPLPVIDYDVERDRNGFITRVRSIPME